MGGKEGKQMVTRNWEQLERLRDIVNEKGTGNERNVVASILDGYMPTDDDIQRLKILGRQFLSEDIEV